MVVLPPPHLRHLEVGAAVGRGRAARLAREGDHLPRQLDCAVDERVLAALEPWLRDQPKTGPSWANFEPRPHLMIDAINLRVTYDPRTDSIHSTTGVGPTVTMTLIGK